MPPAAASDIVVLGGANYDYLARGKQLPGPGETVAGDLIHEAPGGKGANQAVAAARLGARTAFIGKVGQDERGDRIAAALQREGVDVSRLLRDREAPTGVALVQIDAAGQKQILAVGGANLCLTLEDVRSASDLIRGARVLLLQLESPVESTEEAARMAHEAGVKVILDPAPAAPLPDALLGLIDLIKPNAAEAHALTGIDVRDRASAGQCARLLLSRGTAAAAVTAGAHGSLIAWEGGEHWLPRLAVPSIDATGAGDSFAAALAVMLAEGASLAEAGAFAAAAAALTTTVVGAQESLPTREAVLALQERCAK